MKRILLISTFIFSLTLLCVGQNPFITNYTIEDGLPTNKIYCVFHDSKGFLWFGCDVGVIRYDGTNFILFDKQDGLDYNGVVRIKEDSSGRIWLMNFDGSLNYYESNKIFNKSNAPFLGELENNFYFHNFVEKNDSTLYFYNAASEIYVIKNNQYIDYAKFDQFSSNVRTISKASNDNLLLWTTEEIIELNNIDETHQHYPQKNLLLRFTADEQHNTLAMDENGFIHNYHDHILKAANLFQSRSLLINDILIDSDNFYWVSTFNKGLYCYQNGKIVLHLDIEKNQNLIVDHENHIWTISNTHGIFKINRDILKYNTFNKAHFDNKGIREIAAANSNGLWLTNGQTLYWFNNNKIIESTIKVDGFDLESIYHLKNNLMLLNGRSSYLYAISDVFVNPEENEINSGKKTTLRYRVQRAQLDEEKELLYSYVNDHLIIADLKNNLNTSFAQFRWGRIRNLFFNSKKELIVNATQNYSFFNEDSIVLNPEYDFFDGQTIKSQISLDNDSEILSVGDKELYLLNKGRLYPVLDDLQSQVDLNIVGLDYNDSILFFSTAKSIYFLTNPENIIEKQTPDLKRLNIEFNNINDIYYQGETLYVGSDDGLTLIPLTENITTAQAPPKPYFSKIWLDEEETDIPNGIVRYKNKNQINIEFSSFNYSSIPSNYSYKLEGVNESWINGNDQQVVYHNLDPGRYTFKLKARKNLEAFSEEISLPIIVQPTFFQRPIIRISIVLLLLFLGFLVIRSYYSRLIRLREKDYMLVTLENRALQSMMNPHFIFNSLGSIQKFLLENKPEEAGGYLSQFARLIRQTMNSIKSNHVLLDDEVDRLRNYIELEQVRMNQRFEYSIEIDERLEEEEYNIPSMIVQPFVENAIWHGVSPLQEPGTIKVKFNYLDEKRIQIFVEDNGIGFAKSSAFSKSKSNLNMASELTQKRIRLIGEKYKVKAEISKEELFPGKENPGARIKLIVPILD